MNAVTRKGLIRVGVFLLGTLPFGWRVPVGKSIWTKILDRESGQRNDVQTQFQKQDVVGVFRLGYVDCIPYSGSEQSISVDEDGEVQCVEPSRSVPGVTDGGNSSHVGFGKRLGKLKTGTILKGELEPAPGFVSAAAKTAAQIASIKMQVVYLPGGPPGVWLAVSARESGGGQTAWDEIYVRPGFESNTGVAT